MTPPPRGDRAPVLRVRHRAEAGDRAAVDRAVEGEEVGRHEDVLLDLRDRDPSLTPVCKRRSRHGGNFRDVECV